MGAFEELDDLIMNQLGNEKRAGSDSAATTCYPSFIGVAMTFEETLTQAFQHKIIDFIRKGEWMKIDYNARVNVDSAWLREMHSRVDMDNVMSLVASQVEQRIADGIINSMTTEIATDVKSIMSNRELREDIRATIRSKIREAEAALSDG